MKLRHQWKITFYFTSTLSIIYQTANADLSKDEKEIVESALKKNSQAECSKIEHKEMQAKCKQSVEVHDELSSAVNSGDSKKCLNLPTKNYCLLRMAVKLRKVEVCQYIDAPELQSQCLTLTAGENENPLECETTQNSALKERCFANLKNKNDDVCASKVKDIDARIECYTNLASQKKDASPCREIEKLDLKSRNKQLEIGHCISYVAKATKDPSLCQSIQYLPAKSECLSIIAYETKNSSLCQSLPTAEVMNKNYSIEEMKKTKVLAISREACIEFSTKSEKK